MKATILNGALPGDAFVDATGAALHEALRAKGWSVTSWTLRDEKIAYCLGCFECWTKTPGVCRIDDAGRDVAASIIGGDLTIYLTAVTFGGYSSALKQAVDRSICMVSPFFTRIDGEVHHQARYERYPALVGVGVLPAPHPAQEEIFHTLVGRNAINLHAPRAPCGAGAGLGCYGPGFRPARARRGGGAVGPADDAAARLHVHGRHGLADGGAAQRRLSPVARQAVPAIDRVHTQT